MKASPNSFFSSLLPLLYHIDQRYFVYTLKNREVERRQGQGNSTSLDYASYLVTFWVIQRDFDALKEEDDTFLLRFYSALDPHWQSPPRTQIRTTSTDTDDENQAEGGKERELGKAAKKKVEAREKLSLGYRQI